MAGPAYVKKRIYNPELVVDPDDVLPMSLKNTQIQGNNPVYYIKWVGATQAGEELGTAAASVKDGTTTPFQITVVSAGVGDDRGTAAGHVHSVCLLGVSVSSAAAYTAGERPLVTAEVIHMDGTTDVLSTRYYLWVDHAYACEWGTGGTDASAAITIESPANTTLITIPAGNNESDGGVWHFPADRRVYTKSVIFAPTATLAAGDGVVLSGTFTSFEQTNNTDPDMNVDYHTFIHYGTGPQPLSEVCPFGRYTTNASKCLWSETLVANTQTLSIEIVQYLDRGGD